MLTLPGRQTARRVARRDDLVRDSHDRDLRLAEDTLLLAGRRDGHCLTRSRGRAGRSRRPCSWRCERVHGRATRYHRNEHGSDRVSCVSCRTPLLLTSVGRDRSIEVVAAVDSRFMKSRRRRSRRRRRCCGSDRGAPRLCRAPRPRRCRSRARAARGGGRRPLRSGAGRRLGRRAPSPSSCAPRRPTRCSTPATRASTRRSSRRRSTPA